MKNIRIKVEVRFLRLNVLLLISASALFLVKAVTAVRVKNGQPSVSYLVSISQWDSHLSTGELTGDCILVYPDGRFYMEHRFEKSNPPVDIHAFESVLSQEQLTQLNSIVARQTIQELPPFVFPKTPFDVDRYAFFTAKIPRGAGVQNAGYFVWQGGYAKASPAIMPDSVKKSWHDSQLALQPLVGWFDGLKSGKFPESQPALSGCNPPRAK